MTENGEVLENFVDKEAGLLAKNRFAEETKVGLRNDCLAF